MRDLGVAQTAQERQDHLIEIGSVTIPLHQPPDGEPTAQIVAALGAMCSAVGQVEAIRLLMENTMNWA
jgi:hypothetical protein